MPEALALKIKKVSDTQAQLLFLSLPLSLSPVCVWGMMLLSPFDRLCEQLMKVAPSFL
jgi:hypothetical protein